MAVVQILVAVVATAAATSGIMFALLFNPNTMDSISGMVAAREVVVPCSAVNETTATPSAQPTQQPEAVVNPSAPPEPPGPPLSWRKCWRTAGWVDVCSYENVCWDGRLWYFLDADGERGNLADAPIHTESDDMVWRCHACIVPPTCIYIWRAMQLEGLMFPVNAVPSEDEERFPFNSGHIEHRIIHPSLLDSRNVTWSDQTHWRIPFRYELDNIWYTASRVIPIYRIRKMNATGWFNPPLPPLDEDDMLFIQPGEYAFQTDWTQQVMRMVTGDRTPFTYGDGAWNRQWNEDNLVCFKRAVATGSAATGVTDWQNAFEFRRDMYDFVGVEMPAKPARRVLFWFRNDPVGRSILNEQELLDLADSYNISYTLIKNFPRTMKEQLELFATHGVMVSPHGAGLMNVIFLVPFSSVVEIFPYHLDHNLYSTAALHAGLGHYPIHLYNGSDMWSRYELNFKLNCERLTGLDGNWLDGDCRDALIHYRMQVDLRDFEAALVNAMEHAGHRTRFRGIGPTPDANTVTGWHRRRRLRNELDGGTAGDDQSSSFYDDVYESYDYDYGGDDDNEVVDGAARQLDTQSDGGKTPRRLRHSSGTLNGGA